MVLWNTIVNCVDGLHEVFVGGEVDRLDVRVVLLQATHHLGNDPLAKVLVSQACA